MLIFHKLINYIFAGILLDETKFEYNPGLRFIAKLMLNTLWGKLAQRPNQSTTTICNEYNDYLKLITDAKIQITGEILVNQNTLIVNHKFIDDCYSNPGKTSVAIASFVTAFARLKLLKELRKIEKSAPGRVLYFDTDSIVFKHIENSGWYLPKLNNFLGDFTDEIWGTFKTEGAYMNKFASCGPKNYGFTVKFPDGSVKSKIKAKGICLTYENVSQLNFEVMNQFSNEYYNGNELRKTVNQLQFKTDKYHFVYTKIFPKVYRAVSDKRKFYKSDDTGYPYETLPFGYVME